MTPHLNAAARRARLSLRELPLSILLALAAMSQPAPALAQAAPSATPAAPAPGSDEEALSLGADAPPTTPEAAISSSRSRTRLVLEGALGGADARDGSGWHGLRRLSADYSSSWSLAPGWGATLSDRLDYVKPLDPLDSGSQGTVNSLREAYASWQRADGAWAADFGRINMRHGPAYGYNPTDFFRDGSVRVATTTNPIALRETRMGTVALRGQATWVGGSASLALSPKLASGPSSAGESLDLGATNNRTRAVASWTSQWSPRASTELLLDKEAGRPLQIGASATALAGDATVLFAEGSAGRGRDPLAAALGQASPESVRARLAAGMTYAFARNLSVTAEYERDGFAPTRSQWLAAGAANPQALGSYLVATGRSQELATRQAALAYATQKDFLRKNLDLTAMVRVDLEDGSHLVWTELRQHWDRFDLALQAQAQGGRPTAEYGLYPDRFSIQLVGSWFY